MQNNILISSAGRRVELVQAFRKSLDTFLPSASIFCSDIVPNLSAACQYADHFFQVPRVTEPEFIDSLLRQCIENEIGLIIPTIDTELLILSQHVAKFNQEKIKIVISDEALISHCRDKRLTATIFKTLEIDQPAILDKNHLVFPCFCKPYDGSSSLGAMRINSRVELTSAILENKKNIFMELIPKSFSEYTIDAYYSQGHQLKSLVPRKRLEVRAGEVSKGSTRKNFVYEYLLERVQFLQGARGCITFQVFVNEETKEIKGLEINPRFGGGYPLAHAAGAQFTDWLVNEYLLGEQIDFYDTWESNLTMLRYDAKVLTRD